MSRPLPKKLQLVPQCFFFPLWDLSLPPLDFFLLLPQLFAILVERRRILPFCAANAVPATCFFLQTFSEFSSSPYFLPPFISSTNLSTGASGTASKVLRMPPFLPVSILPTRRTRIWPFSSAT